MNITMLGRNGPRKNMIEALVRYYIRELKLGDSKFNLTVRFEKIEQENEAVELGAAAHFGKEIHVRLDSKLDRYALIKTLGHEMIHVKQIAKGQLKLVPRLLKSGITIDVFWLGKKMKKTIPYLQRPWEIEALSKEEILYRTMAAHFVG
jgi:hypothetical protein